MKGTIISMLIVLVVLSVLPILFFGDNTFLEDLGFGGGGSGGDSIASLKAKAPKNISAVRTDTEVKMYKWVDENGVMQFTQTPPPGGAEEMTLSPNLNTMEATRLPPKEDSQQATTSFKPVTNPYTPGGTRELMQQATEIKKLMEQRQLEQQKMLAR